MKKKREARVGEERVGMTCPGCNGWPCRESWLEPCATCDSDVCRLCRDECKCTAVCTTSARQ
jgi:hypothetical protein